MELQPLASQLSLVAISWLSVQPRHIACCGTLDLLMIDVPDLVRVAVVAPIGNSDHSSLLAFISMAQLVTNFCVSRKVFLKHQVIWNTVCGAIQDLPWRNICLADNPVDVLNEHLYQLVGRYVSTKIICVRNMDKPWFDDQCSHALGLNQEANFRCTCDRSRVNWEEFVHCQVRANDNYSEAKRQVGLRNGAPHKWWSTLKFVVFGSSSSLPSLVVVVIVALPRPVWPSRPAPH